MEAPIFERAKTGIPPFHNSELPAVPTLTSSTKKEPSSDGTGFRIQRSPSTEPRSTPKVPASPPPSDPVSPTAARPRSAPPLPKRNKGQLFLAVIFISFFVGIFYTVYATFFQYKAYGIVSGRLIEVGAPWDGTVTLWQVRDGDLVKQGDIVAVISNIDMEHELQQMDDELRYAQAQVDAEASKIRFNYSDKSDREQKALAEYLESQGNLLSEQSILDDLERRLKRSQKLMQSGSVSPQAHDELYFKCSGQRKKVASLNKAVQVLRDRSTTSSGNQDLRKQQLDPLLIKIQQIQAQRERLRARIDRGRILAPVSGRVTLRTQLTGESVQQGDTLVEILEDNSSEAILYVPQGFTDQFKEGSQIMLTLEPFEKQVPCTVERIHNQFQPAPSSIERYYQQNQHLLPVHLTPLPGFRDEFAKRINGTVKLPYSWDEWVGDLWTSISERIQSDSVSDPNETIARFSAEEVAIAEQPTLSEVGQTNVVDPSDQSIYGQ